MVDAAVYRRPDKKISTWRQLKLSVAMVTIELFFL